MEKMAPEQVEKAKGFFAQAVKAKIALTESEKEIKDIRRKNDAFSDIDDITK